MFLTVLLLFGQTLNIWNFRAKPSQDLLASTIKSHPTYIHSAAHLPSRVICPWLEASTKIDPMLHGPLSAVTWPVPTTLAGHFCILFLLLFCQAKGNWGEVYSATCPNFRDIILNWVSQRLGCLSNTYSLPIIVSVGNCSVTAITL